ncbi:MAG: hypothetical protein HY906_25505 [Deltaproteobacteria bacterium]|nr:hypothetical protein [Deltaproteobacteria bacterium]
MGLHVLYPPVVEVNATGTLWLFWVECAPSTYGCPGRRFERVRDAAGNWSAPYEYPANVRPLGGGHLDPEGGRHLVWPGYLDGDPGTIHHYYLAPALDPPGSITAVPVAQAVWSTIVAGDWNSQVVLVVETGEEGGAEYEAATLGVGPGDSWARGRTLVPRGVWVPPTRWEAYVAPTGTIHLVWLSQWALDSSVGHLCHLASAL